MTAADTWAAILFGLTAGVTVTWLIMAHRLDEARDRLHQERRHCAAERARADAAVKAAAFDRAELCGVRADLTVRCAAEAHQLRVIREQGRRLDVQARLLTGLLREDVTA